MTIWRTSKFISVVLLAIAATGLVSVDSASANSFAAHVSGTGGDGLTVRSSPSTSAARVSLLGEGANVTIDCYGYGTNVAGYWYTGNLWQHITSPYNGWVSDTYLYTGYNGPIPGESQCGPPPPPPPPPTPPCLGVSCVGRNATSVGCSGTTVLSKTYVDSNRRWLAELRYSANCGAGWLRLTPYDKGLGFAMSAWNPGGASYGSVGSSATSVWTGMVNATGHRQVCGGTHVYSPTGKYLRWVYLGCWTS